MRMLIAVYIAAMVIANMLVWWLGPWSSPFIAFVLIGLDLTLRDVMHDRLTKWQMLGVVLVGGALTWLLNPSAAHIAVASATAFTASAVADWLAYTFLRSKPWLIRSNGSNVVGAAVDSLIFPTLAFGGFLPHIVLMQLAAKVGGGAIWSVLLRKAMPA
jgi:queuosine precursor transporter